MTTSEALDHATKQWLARWYQIIGERSGSIREDKLEALREVNAIRRPFLPPIDAKAFESYNGELT